MNMTKLEQKQAELINHLYYHLKKGLTDDRYREWYNKKRKLESEIAELQKQEEGKEYFEKVYIKSEKDLPENDETEKNDIIFNLNVRIGELIDKYNKKWWQFWK